MNVSFQDPVRHHRTDHAVAAVAAQLLHDGVGRRRRRLHARRRPGARRGHQHRHQRAQGRRRHGEGRRRRHAGLFRAAREGQEPAGHPGLHGDLRPARIHQGRDAASRQGRRLRDRAELLFPLRRGSHQDHRNAEADADRERQDRRRAVRRSRRHRGVGEVAGRRHQPARHHGLLPRRPQRLALLDAQSEPEGRRRVLRQPGRQERRGAEELDRARARGEGAGARSLRRRGHRHQGRAGQGDGREAQGRQQDRRIPDLSRRAARLPRRLPAELPQGGGRGRAGTR